MATLAIQKIDKLGLEPDFDPATSGGGDKAPCGPGCYLEVHNGGGSPINVVFVTPGLIDGDLTIQDRTVAVPAGETRKIALRDAYANKADGGLATITYSAVTDVTVGAFRVPLS